MSFTVCVPVLVPPDLPCAFLPCPIPVLQGVYLPGYSATPDEPHISYGLQRLDHAVGNVHKLVEALEHIIGFTGQQQTQHSGQQQQQQQQHILFHWHLIQQVFWSF
jgi:hypothetical protein